MKCILGKKIGMTTIYNDNGVAMNVTLIGFGENTVDLVRTEEKDGYKAVRIQTAKTKRTKHVKEFRVEEATVNAGDVVTIDGFEIGDKVKISGITKAKGFQGVVKRHGFAGAPKSHGRKHDWRKPGSIGSSFPEHVTKGKKMAGRMGGRRFTVKNLTVAYIDKEKSVLGVRGAVPGVTGRIVEVRG